MAEVELEAALTTLGVTVPTPAAGLDEAAVQALIEAYAQPLSVAEDLGTDGDDFEGTALDAAWTLGGGASASFLDDHTVSLALGAQKARMLRNYTPPTNVNCRALLRNLSSDGGMTGIAFLDASGNGFVACPYQGTLYMFNVTDYAYVDAIGSDGGVPNQEAFWLEVEKVGTGFRVRTSPDPAGLVNWSAWSAAGTKTNTFNRVGILRAYTGVGAVTVRVDKWKLPA